MKISRGLVLGSRRILRLRGPDTLDFLQGLVTPDVKGLEKNGEGIRYGFALDVRGRILFDFFLQSIPHETEKSFALDLDSEESQDLALRHLQKYRLRRKVEIIKDSDLGVLLSPESSRGLQDPRCCGTNIQIFRSLEKRNSNLDDELEYRDFRYSLGWAEGKDEIPPGKCFPLEYNGDILPGKVVNFSKGCYVGQELTARTRHVGVVRKRIMPLIFQDPSSSSLVSEFNDAIIDSKGQNVGKLRSGISSGGRAIGLLKIKESLSSNALYSNERACRTEHPSWWPHP